VKKIKKQRPNPSASRRPIKIQDRQIQKSPTGIQGLDHILNGGLPKGRPTLICGGAGCGKTLLAMEFLVRGAKDFGEPGVFFSFEESEAELVSNFAPLQYDLIDLQKKNLLRIDRVQIDRSDIEETGEYDLEGLFVRLDHAIKEIGAKRVILDTIESLFSGLKDQSVLRSELRRLFRWLKERGVTSVITGEKGEGVFTRQGLEEYVSDCVIVLDNRVNHEISTRRLRIVKYRGSLHGADEYPFLIDRSGVSVIPVSALTLDHPASDMRISSGIRALDEMLDGKGYFCGSSILISGTAGTGKTSLSASFVAAACKRGERTLYFCFEESQAQLFRNMQSIGIDLEKWHRKGLLKVVATRPSFYGVEMHLVHINKMVEEFNPSCLVVDPISNMVNVGSFNEIRAMMMRLIDFLKSRQITSVFTSLNSAKNNVDDSDTGVSSLIDTWISVKEVDAIGERNRSLYIMKSRGMPHSNQIREFILSANGIELVDIYIGADGIVTGSARRAEEALGKAQASVTDYRRRQASREVVHSSRGKR
jgi:circadian clock protein KaiC